MPFFTKKPTQYYCFYCNESIPTNVHEYSVNNLGAAFCMRHQRAVKTGLDNATNEARILFFALLKRGIRVHVEKFDGFKHIDLAIPTAMVNIEIDGMHHSYNSRQALSDLQRTLYSFKKGYLTLRIPNALIHNNLNQTVKHVEEFIYESYDQLDEY